MHSRATRRPSRRRLLCAIGLASIGSLSGCVGDTTTGEPAADRGDGARDGDGNTDTADAIWNPFEFDRPVTYTYEIYSTDDGSGTLVWDVTDVTDDGATVALQYDTAETQFETTVTGSKDDLQGQLLMTPAGPFIVATIFSPTMARYEGQTLTVGNEWSYSSPDGSMRFAITERDTIAGVDCYASVTEVDGSTVHEGCFSPELELAPYTVYYDDDGTRSVEMRLVSIEE
ncbi:hypothetical protein [Natrinema salaciae]|uniref:Uncharacterized protein n=1 Tax=Natrinema salaciae TaxID=1186196 RepID=A0A1H9QEE1_9EURY|nr:hypothetical protein [Natrinema salaciae]SER58249.1 hypothetical protein SAMN04489841_4167 [Natrinema salaciae]